MSRKTWVVPLCPVVAAYQTTTIIISCMDSVKLNGISHSMEGIAVLSIEGKKYLSELYSRLRDGCFLKQWVRVGFE